MPNCYSYDANTCTCTGCNKGSGLSNGVCTQCSVPGCSSYFP